MSSTEENDDPKKQLETARGGAGRKGKTTIGAGDGGDSDDFQSWPADADLPSGVRPRILICIRNELIRRGLNAMLERIGPVIGEAQDGKAGLELIRRLRPDLIIVDVDLDALSGLEVCRRTRQELPNTAIMVFTDSYHATKYFHQLGRAGADGFCLLSSTPRMLVQGITQIIEKQSYVDPKITELIHQAPETNMPNYNLTQDETEVLIRLDLRNKEISEELDMKLRTVEKHIEVMLPKLKVPTRTAAALRAVQLGYVLLPKMPSRDPVTGKTDEFLLAEKYAEEALRRQGKS